VPATGGQTTANMPTVASSISPQHDVTATTQETASSSTTPMNQPTTTAATTTASTAVGSTASSAQSYPTTDLPTTGANTTSAPSLMLDTTPIILDLGQEAALNQMVLDMVMTSPTQLPISPEAQELVNSKLAELADKYQANDPLRYLEALVNTLQCIQEHNPRNVSLQLVQALQTKGHIEPSDIPLLYQCALHLTHGIVQTITDVPGLIHAHAKLVKLIFECAIVDGLREWQIDPIQALGPDNEVSKVAKAIEAINPESIKKVLQHIALMNPQEQSKAVGNIVGSYLQGKILAGLIPTALKTVENITQVVAEGRVGQAMAQSVEKLAHGARRIGTAEEAIAVTAEGVPVCVATTAQETLSLQQTANKVGGAAKEISTGSKPLSSSFLEEIEQRFAGNKHLIDTFDLKIKELIKFTSSERVGERITMETSFLKMEKIEAEVTHFYESIRATTDDITGIVKNTGISEGIIKQIKQNVFFDEHILIDGIKRFAPQADMAAAWQRLMCGNFVHSDLLLLQHEYAESLIMKGLQIAYDPAHAFVDKLYNWKNAL